MSCQTCGRREVAGSCNEGFVHYLSGDYPCVFNKRDTAPRNLRELPALCHKRTGKPDSVPFMSAEGLEDLL
jgi:hypothetical protein